MTCYFSKRLRCGYSHSCAIALTRKLHNRIYCLNSACEKVSECPRYTCIPFHNLAWNENSVHNSSRVKDCELRLRIVQSPICSHLLTPISTSDASCAPKSSAVLTDYLQQIYLNAKVQNHANLHSYLSVVHLFTYMCPDVLQTREMCFSLNFNFGAISRICRKSKNV